MRYLLHFKKFSNLRLTSHIDTMNIIENTLRRSDCPFAYSEGFNPKPLFSYIDALPLGYINRCLYLTVDTIKEFDFSIVNRYVPLGLKLEKFGEYTLNIKINKLIEGYFFKIYLSDNIMNFFKTIKTVQKGKSEYNLNSLFNDIEIYKNKKDIFVVKYYQDKNYLFNFFKLFKDSDLRNCLFFYYPFCYDIKWGENYEKSFSS